MAIRTSDTFVTGEYTQHWAYQDRFNGRWHVTWLPGRPCSREHALVALLLAELVATMQEEGRTAVVDHTHPLWPEVDHCAAQLGMTGPAAMGLASEGLDVAPPGWRTVPDGQAQDPQTGNWCYTREGAASARARQNAELNPGRAAMSADGEPTPIIPAAGSYRPGAVNVRLVCPPDTMAAVLASLSDLYGDAWQPNARRPARSSDGHLLQYGTLIVAVPVAKDPQTPH